MVTEERNLSKSVYCYVLSYPYLPAGILLLIS